MRSVLEKVPLQHVSPYLYHYTDDPYHSCTIRETPVQPLEVTASKDTFWPHHENEK